MLSGELFIAAIRKCGGVIAEGESASSALMEDTRKAFNVLLDSWSAERLSVFSTQDQTLTWPANEATQTIGVTGDLTAVRPQKVLDSSFLKDISTGISYALVEINEETYNSIAVKTSASSIPRFFLVNNTVPDITITFYPVPSQALEFHLISIAILTQVDDLVTEIVMPPGYLRALTYNLAAEIAPELGIEPPPTTQRIAMASKRVLKANNSPKDIMSLPEIFTDRRFGYNIYSG